MKRLTTLLARPASLMGGGRLVVAALGLAATPLFTRVLTPAAYGTYALATAITTIASTIPTQWLNAATLRYAPKVGGEQSRILVRRGLAASLSPVVFVALGLSIATFRVDPTIVLLTTVYAMCEAVFVAYWVLNRALLRSWSFAIGGIVRNLVSVAIVFVASGSHSIDVNFVMLAMIVASLSGTCSMLVTGLRPVASSRGHDGLTSWFRYGWPMILNYALGLAFAYVNRFIILALSGRDAVGLFAPTYDLMFSIITLTTGLVGLTAVPRLFAVTDENLQSRMLKALRRRVIVVSVGITAVMIVTWPWVSRLLIGDQLRVTDWFFVTVLGSSFALLAYRFQYLNVSVQLSERTKLQMVATATGLAVNVLLNVLLIPSFGMNGAAIATLAGAVTAAALLVLEPLLGRRQHGDRR